MCSLVALRELLASRAQRAVVLGERQQWAIMWADETITIERAHQGGATANQGCCTRKCGNNWGRVVVVQCIERLRGIQPR